jgi:hypothetical protein
MTELENLLVKLLPLTPLYIAAEVLGFVRAVTVRQFCYKLVSSSHGRWHYLRSFTRNHAANEPFTREQLALH